MLTLDLLDKPLPTYPADEALKLMPYLDSAGLEMLARLIDEERHRYVLKDLVELYETYKRIKAMQGFMGNDYNLLR